MGLPVNPRKDIWIPLMQLSLGQMRHDSVRVSPGMEWDFLLGTLSKVNGDH